MLLIRRFEERVYRLFLEGEIPGTLHQYQGQEAVAVGVCDVLGERDWITSTHRPTATPSPKGSSPRAAMAELYGKATGCCGARAARCISATLPSGCCRRSRSSPAATPWSAASGSQSSCAGDDQVAVCFFGEGATNEGAFHEGLNFAAVQRLPIVFACENNLYGASTSFSAVSLVEDVAARASAYGVPARIVDGMDVLAVRAARAEAVAAAPRRRRADAARVQDLSLHRATAEATRADTAAPTRSRPGRAATR